MDVQVQTIAAADVQPEIKKFRLYQIVLLYLNLTLEANPSRYQVVLTETLHSWINLPRYPWIKSCELKFMFV